MAKIKVFKLLRVFVIAIIIATLLIAFHYLYFESTRLSTCGVDIFNDWRSYVASVMQKIPFVKDKIRYTPLKIGDPNYYYKNVVSSYAEEINLKLEELNKEKEHIEKQKKLLEIEMKAVKGLQSKWEKFYETEELNKKVYRDFEESVKRLADLMKESDAENVALIINQDSIGVETIAAALKYLPNDVSAEVVQALGKINPKKAAAVLKQIGSIDREIENIKAEKEELKRTLEKIIQEKKKVLNIQGLEEVISKYINDMTPEQLVDLIKDMKLSVDEIIKMVNIIEPSKRRDFLDYLRKEEPSVFVEIFKRGLGG